MGTDRQFCCEDCRVNINLGYGSAMSWIDVRTVGEYDENCKTHGDLKKNVNMRRALVEHDGHNHFCWSYDWCSVDCETGALLLDAGYEVKVLIPDFREYTKLNWDDS